MISRTMRQHLSRIAAQAVCDYLTKEGYNVLSRGDGPYCVVVDIQDVGTGFRESMTIKVQGRQ